MLMKMSIKGKIYKKKILYIFFLYLLYIYTFLYCGENVFSY